MEVKLRRWRLEDADALARIISNKKILDNLRDGLPYPYTKKDAEDYISFVLSAGRDSQYIWAITVNDEIVGNIGFTRKDNIHRYTAEMGYYIAEPYWGKGIATEAVKLGCAYIFENTDIIRIFAEPFADNLASCRVLEKAGFTLEGVMRKNAVKNGEIRDMKLYSIVKD